MYKPLTHRILQEELNKHQKRVGNWPAVYINSDTGRRYEPHNDQERQWVESDDSPYPLIKGGEGSGKSVAGIIKTLNRLRKGMSGVMVSPNLPHFKRSLWPEFRRWCPWACVADEHRHYSSAVWSPTQTFTIVFNAENGAQSTLICGGITQPRLWEGPNVSFAHIDEARGLKDDEALKVLAGRIRIDGPNGEKPQLYITTTPIKKEVGATDYHWLYQYYGDIEENDPYLDFKRKTFVVTLSLQDNAKNLSQSYIENRGSMLSEVQHNIRVKGEWDEETSSNPFLPDMSYWHRLQENLPPVKSKKTSGRNYSDALIVGVDGSYSRDSFGIVAVSRHPKQRDHVAVRMAYVWKPSPKKKLDYQGTANNPGPEMILRQLCAEYNVVGVFYDPRELHDMMNRLSKDHVAFFKEFQQGKPRDVADQQLYDLIILQKLSHNGDHELTMQIANCDKVIKDGGTRIKKRGTGLHNDMAVALSMACHYCLEYNL